MPNQITLVLFRDAKPPSHSVTLAHGSEPDPSNCSQIESHEPPCKLKDNKIYFISFPQKKLLQTFLTTPLDMCVKRRKIKFNHFLFRKLFSNAKTVMKL